MMDRLFLEIVTEGKVAEHLEEGVMPRGIANIVEIIVLATRPHTFLRACCTQCRRRFKPGECILERHHPRIDEHEGRIIVRHKRRARDLGVISSGEVLKKRAADIIGRRHAWAVKG